MPAPVPRGRVRHSLASRAAPRAARRARAAQQRDPADARGRSRRHDVRRAECGARGAHGRRPPALPRAARLLADTRARAFAVAVRRLQRRVLPRGRRARRLALALRLVRRRAQRRALRRGVHFALTPTPEPRLPLHAA